MEVGWRELELPHRESLCKKRDASKTVNARNRLGPFFDSVLLLILSSYFQMQAHSYIAICFSPTHKINFQRVLQHMKSLRPYITRIFYHALRVPCDRCLPWLDSNRHTSLNSHAMGARRGNIKTEKIFSWEIRPAEPDFQ